MSWPWIVLAAVAVGIVVAAEWPRLVRVTGADARRKRRRTKRKAGLRVITTDPAVRALAKDPDSDEFAQSVQRDLDSLPTIDEPRTKR